MAKQVRKISEANQVSTKELKAHTLSKEGKLFLRARRMLNQTISPKKLKIQIFIRNLPPVKCHLFHIIYNTG